MGKLLRAGAAKVRSLRILCVPKYGLQACGPPLQLPLPLTASVPHPPACRGVPWSAYHYAAMQDARAKQTGHVMLSREHKHAVATASANVQHHL